MTLLGLKPGQVPKGKPHGNGSLGVTTELSLSPSQGAPPASPLRWAAPGSTAHPMGSLAQPRLTKEQQDGAEAPSVPAGRQHLWVTAEELKLGLMVTTPLLGARAVSSAREEAGNSSSGPGAAQGFVVGPAFLPASAQGLLQLLVVGPGEEGEGL